MLFGTKMGGKGSGRGRGKADRGHNYCGVTT